MQVIVQKAHWQEQRELFTLETGFSVTSSGSETYELWQVKDELAGVLSRYMVYCFPLDGRDATVESVFPPVAPGFACASCHAWR